MRWVRDFALLIVLAGFIGGGIIYMRKERDQEAMVQQAAAELVRLETEIKYRSATRTAELNQRGWPVTMDPKWFQPRPPMNALVSPDRPWVEIASMSEAGLLHPPVRVTVDPSLAAFWYNPYQGIVRARVPVMVNDEKTLEVYNRVNGAGLASLFVRETPVPTPDLNNEHQADEPAADKVASADVPVTSHPVEAGSAADEGKAEGDEPAPGATAEPYGPPVVKVDRTRPKK